MDFFNSLVCDENQLKFYNYKSNETKKLILDLIVLTTYHVRRGLLVIYNSND